MDDYIYTDDEGLKQYNKLIDNLIRNVNRIDNEIKKLKKNKRYDEIQELYSLREKLLVEIEEKKNTLALVELVEKRKKR